MPLTNRVNIWPGQQSSMAIITYVLYLLMGYMQYMAMVVNLIPVLLPVGEPVWSLDLN